MHPMKRILFSMLVDFGYPKSVMQSIPLIKSIRKYGSSLKDSDILLCYVGKMTDSYLKAVSHINGIKFKQVDQFHPNHKHSNKLRIYEQPEIFEYEFLCALDCDTVILGDISPTLKDGAISMKMADGKTISSKIMKRVFGAANQIYPSESYKTTNGHNSIAYCNNGFLVTDTSNINFFKIWKKKTMWLCENQNLLDDKRFFTEQVSLSLAIYESGINLNLVDVIYNFPTHNKLKLKSVPIVAHYHDQMKGGILKTPYQKINDMINLL